MVIWCQECSSPTSHLLLCLALLVAPRSFPAFTSDVHGCFAAVKDMAVTCWKGQASVNLFVSKEELKNIQLLLSAAVVAPVA